MLTGKYLPVQPALSGSRMADDEMSLAMDLVHNEATLEAVQRLVPLAEDADMSVAEMALAWVLRRSDVASAITGAFRPEQVTANAAASGIELSSDLFVAIDEALGDAPVKQLTLAPFALEGVTHR